MSNQCQDGMRERQWKTARETVGETVRRREKIREKIREERRCMCVYVYMMSFTLYLRGNVKSVSRWFLCVCVLINIWEILSKLRKYLCTFIYDVIYFILKGKCQISVEMVSERVREWKSETVRETVRGRETVRERDSEREWEKSVCVCVYIYMMSFTLSLRKNVKSVWEWYVCVYVYMYMWVCVCGYMCMYVCMCVCVCGYMCICVHVCIHAEMVMLHSHFLLVYETCEWENFRCSGHSANSVSRLLFTLLPLLSHSYFCSLLLSPLTFAHSYALTLFLLSLLLSHPLSLPLTLLLRSLSLSLTITPSHSLLLSLT